MNQALLRVRDLCVDFGAQAAIAAVNFELYPGETVGLVGESGSGKSTLARAILRLLPARGSVQFAGSELLTSPAAILRMHRRELQIIFQDPLASLDPRMQIGVAIAEPLQIFEPAVARGDLERRVGEMLQRVGLRADMAGRYPHELSGGECQRVGIARAMILNPKLLICDEAVSSLDVSIQGQIVNLLLDLQQDTGMAMLFISHNLAVVRHLSHRVLVIYLGKLVEIAPSEALFAAPLHPYTLALLASVPRISPGGMGASQGPALAERVLTPGALAGGCAFRNRCPYALPLCESTVPPLAEVKPGHWVACHRSHETLNPLSFAP
jgi:oligopeptide/dipeptide ABC transporter ATP-binding protein